VFRKDKWLLNKAQVKGYVKDELGLRFADTSFEPLHGLVQRIIHMAAKQAEVRKRSTIMKDDFDFWL